MKNLVLLMFYLITISGCASTQWTHPNKTESDFYRDSMQCETYAREAVQSSSSKPVTRYREPSYNTQCRGTNYGYSSNVECRTERDRTYDEMDRRNQAGADLGSSIANSFLMGGHYSNCMKSLGYVEK